jgi:UDP-N-acetyl-D-mannosaminuronic acid dehydrogenase
MNVGVIGLGYVGLTFSAVLAKCGVQVYGIERNSSIYARLLRGEAHFYEPGLNELLKEHLGGRLIIRQAFPHEVDFDAFVITVGTPLREESEEPNLDYILGALDALAPVYHGDELIVLRSTVSPGTTRKVVLPYMKKLCRRPEHQLYVAFCPERTIEGKALVELTELPQIISGNQQEAIYKAKALFAHLTSNLIETASLEEAELVKLFNNTYRDMHFAVGNVLCMVAQKYGVDGQKVICRANEGYQRSDIPLPGLVGGPCIAKDAHLLTHFLPDSPEKKFVQLARHYNESLADKIVSWVENKARLLNKRTVAISGLAFKGKPDTSDLRNSVPLRIAEKLAKEGFALHLHDFICPTETLSSLHIGKIHEDFYDCVRPAKLVLILNNNQRYTQIETWTTSSDDKIQLLDVWGVCPYLAEDYRISYTSLGNMFVSIPDETSIKSQDTIYSWANEQAVEQVQQDIAFLCSNVEIINRNWKIDDAPIYNRFAPVVFVKRLIRKMTYWLIKPQWEQQMHFNQLTAAALSDLMRIHSRLLGQKIEQMVDSEVNLVAETDEPRVIQLVSSLNYGDAVGNDAIAIKHALRAQGIITEIYALNIHKKLKPGTARFFSELPPLKDNDLVIYHFASESPLSDQLGKLKGIKLLRYHNITPPSFFHGFDHETEKNCSVGLKQIEKIKEHIDACLPVSQFNKQCLIEIGYNCPMYVAPILIHFEDYAQEPDAAVIDRYRDGVTNVVFVGRVAPNKKIEDVISAFAYYREHHDKTARLFLVGAFSPDNKYYLMLREHLRKLGVQDVIFPGHIPFAQILSYYKIADIFLCMSEHEGFCVPLVEAMYFKVPIVAYASTAIPDTLGGSGVLVESKNCAEIAKVMERVVQDKGYRQQVVEGQSERLKDFDNMKIKKELLKALKIR